jgi:hypothetical protein
VGDDVETLGDEDTSSRVGDGVSIVAGPDGVKVTVGEEAGLTHRQPLIAPVQIASQQTARSSAR